MVRVMVREVRGAFTFVSMSLCLTFIHLILILSSVYPAFHPVRYNVASLFPLHCPPIPYTNTYMGTLMHRPLQLLFVEMVNLSYFFLSSPTFKRLTRVFSGILLTWLEGRCLIGNQKSQVLVLDRCQGPIPVPTLSYTS